MENNTNMNEHHSVDLGAHPPYHAHPPPEGFKQETADPNRNFPVEDNANNRTTGFSTFSRNNNTRVTPPRAPPSSVNSTPKRTLAHREQLEARNDAVIRRVAEMKALVEHNGGSGGSSTNSTTSSSTTTGNAGGSDSDSIVSANRSETSDVSSISNLAFGAKVRQSDSLIALQDEGEAVAGLAEAVNRSLAITKGRFKDFEEEDDDEEDEEEEDEEEATSGRKAPMKTTQQIGRLKQSDSSFGLHSPDNLPVGLELKQTEVSKIAFYIVRY